MAIKNINISNSLTTTTYKAKISNQNDLFTIILNDKQFLAKIISIVKDIITFQIGEQLYKASVKKNSTETTVTLLNQEHLVYNISNQHSNNSKNSSTNKDTLLAPITGKIIKTYVSANQFVKKDQELLVIESMKMENEILAEQDAFIKSISIREGDLVQSNQVLITFDMTKEIKGENNEKRDVQNRGPSQRT